MDRHDDFDRTYVEYEEDSSDSRVYKVYHAPVGDGGWHDLRRDYEARYRIVGERMQYVSAKKAPVSRERDELLAFLLDLAPVS